MPTVPIAPRVPAPPLRWRRNATQLTAQQLADLRRAMTRMQAIGDDRGYMRHAGIHGLPLPISCQHGTNLFLPWHRAYLYFFERALRDGLLPLGGQILCVSGRLSFELVQKAAVAGAPILVGVGAPTSLAIELAADRGMTLAGFARGTSVNVYSGAERVA